jgi:hypothetical protein
VHFPLGTGGDQDGDGDERASSCTALALHDRIVMTSDLHVRDDRGVSSLARGVTRVPMEVSCAAAHVLFATRCREATARYDLCSSKQRACDASHCCTSASGQARHIVRRGTRSAQRAAVGRCGSLEPFVGVQEFDRTWMKVIMSACDLAPRIAASDRVSVALKNTD